MFTAIPAASDKNGTGGILDASLSVVNTIEVTSNEMSTVSEPDPTPVSDVPTLSFPSCMEEVEEARTVGRVFVALVMVCGLKKGEGGRAIRGFAQKEYKRALSSTGTPLTFSRCPEMNELGNALRSDHRSSDTYYEFILYLGLMDVTFLL